MNTKQHKSCFVICPFGSPESNERKRSDMLLEYLIFPATKDFKYQVSRADLSAQPGIVTVHVIQHLIEDELVIADISDKNPNVFYELAIRHAIRKPYIQLVSINQKIPFNIQEIQTVIYDLTDVKKIKETIDKIKKQIIFYEAGGKVTSPVTVAIDELIGTRSLEQFTELVKKLADLDQSIEKAQKVAQEIENVKYLVKEVRSDIQSMSKSSSSQKSSSSSSYDNSSSASPKPSSKGRKEYSASEYIDIIRIEEKRLKERKPIKYTWGGKESLSTDKSQKPKK